MSNQSYLKFSVLSVLSPEDIKNIKSVYIFGETGSEVIIINKQEKVFSFGSNNKGVLGLGHPNPTLVPIVLPELCDKGIVTIRSGEDFALALTQSGHLYSWGHNNEGQLGNGSEDANYYKPTINKTLFEINVNVIDMSCGFKHSLILTNDGEVYSFGRNNEGQIGCDNYDNQLIPIKINQSFFHSEEVISISCGSNHSLALIKSGRVFSWGYNFQGQLGNGNNNIYQSIPIIIESIKNTLFKKVSGGSHHSLLLSFEGYIYTFGYNNCGQIGNGTKDNKNIPLKLEHSSLFKDIATDSQSHISVTIAMNGNCYVWGDCIDGEVMTPKETQFKSIHDVFAEYGKRRITYIPSVVKLESNEISGTSGPMASGIREEIGATFHIIPK